MWVGWNLLGMLGLWGTAAAAYFFLDANPWLQLFDRGQFFLYSVGILVQVLYILTKEWKITTLPGRRVLFMVSLFCFMVCVAFFTGTVLANEADSPSIVPKIELLRWLGIGMLCFSMVVGLIVTIVAENREQLIMSTFSQQNIDRLASRLPRM